MPRADVRFEPRGLEEATRRFWVHLALPPASAVVGPPAGPLTHQMFGVLTRDETAVSLLQRAVIADVETRYLAQTGRRTRGKVILSPGVVNAPLHIPPDLPRRLGVWIGGGEVETSGGTTDPGRIQSMVDRLASGNLLVSRETPLRFCPRCALPRTPAGIVYLEAAGPTSLVRFPLRGSAPRTSLLVWIDSLWKLLGATAVVVNPEQSYVTVRYRRRDSEELLVVSRSGLDRLLGWLPGATVEVVDERPGTGLAGLPYDHPLASEAPGLGAIQAPAGTVQASGQVTDTGTGVVALVPSHGAADAEVAGSLGIAGWPVLDTDLLLSSAFSHKYQGLTVDAADAFIQRDLGDGGYLFAQLTVHRGVPHCTACGEPLVWRNARAWCLEPGRLPAERLDLYARLLGDEAAPPTTEAIPWPVSESGVTDDHDAPVLLECPRCDRLAPVGASPACPCGGERTPARRTLLPILRATFETWAHETPFPAGEALRLYVAERRRLPAVVHHLVALEAVEAKPGDVRLSVIPTLPEAEGPFEVGAEEPLDAVRSTLVGFSAAPRAGPVALSNRRIAETRRIQRVWDVVQETVAEMAQEGYSVGSIPIASRLADLLPEDRAFLSIFERMRSEVFRLYDLGNLARAQRRLAAFFDLDLRLGYLALVHRRRQMLGLPPEKVAVFMVLGHVLPLWTELYSPIAPFVCEAAHRALRGDAASVFDRPHTPLLDVVLDPKAERSYLRWRSVSRALGRVRHTLGVPADTPLGRLVLFIRDEAAATELRAATDVLARLTNVTSLEIASPRVPWEGKRVTAVPVLPEIQKVFGTGSPRVVRLLSGLAGRRVQEGIRSHSLQVAVEGRPVEILPSMVEFVETLPEGFVPIPWELGELFLQVPTGSRTGDEGRAPPLTPDGYRMIRRIHQRLRRATHPTAVPGIVVFAQGLLTEEVERQQTALARYLGVGKLRVVSSAEGFPPAETIEGRSGRGERWAVWVPGVPAPNPRRKDRARRPESPAGLPQPGRRDGSAVDYLSPAVLQRESDIQEWMQKLDVVLGRPIVGPAKLRYAWESGLRTYDALTQAPYELLSQVPGFGPQVAGEVLRHFGGSVPVGPRLSGGATLGPSGIEAARPIRWEGVRRSPSVSTDTMAPLIPSMAPPATSASHDAPAPATAGEVEPPVPSDVEPGPPSTQPALTLVPDTETVPRSGASVPAAENKSVEPHTEASGVPETTEPPEMSVEPGPEVHSETPPHVDEAGAAVPAVREPPSEPVPDQVPAEVEEPSPTPPVAPGPGSPEPSGEIPSLAEPDRPPPTAPSSTEPSPAPTQPAAIGPTLPPLETASTADVSDDVPRIEPPVESALESVPLEPPEVRAEFPPDVLPAVAPPSEPEGSSALPATDVGPDDGVPDVSALPLPPAPVPESLPPAEVPEPPLPDEMSAEPGREQAALPEPVESIADRTPPPLEPPTAGVDAPLIPAVEPGEVVPGTVDAHRPEGGDVAGGEEPSPTPAPASEVPSVGPREGSAPTGLPEETPAPSTPPTGPEPTAVEPEEPASPEPLGVTGTETQAPPSEPPPGPSEGETLGPRADGPPVPEIAQAAEGTSTPSEPTLQEPPSTADVLIPDSSPPMEPPVPSRPGPIPAVAPPAPAVAEPSVVVPPRPEPDVVPELEAPLPVVSPIPPPEPDPPRPPVGVLLSAEGEAGVAWAGFLDATAAGHRGLCVSREFPDRLRILLGPRDVDVLWLSNSGRRGTAKPSDLDAVRAAVEEGFRDARVTAVYVDNVEYLLRANPVDRVVDFLEKLDAAARQRGARVWVPVNAVLLRPEDGERLRAHFGPGGPVG